MTGAPQFSVLSFCSGLTGSDASATSAGLYTFLQKIISDNLTDTRRILAAEKQIWITLIGGLCEHFLATFPTSGSSSWKALEEKIRLCFVSLDVLERASSRVDTLFLDSDDHSLKILSQILTFLAALATWDAPGAPEEGSYGSLTLKDKAISAIDAVLGCLKENGSGRSILCKLIGEAIVRGAKGWLS